MSVRTLRRGNIARSGVLAPSTVNVLALPGTAGNYVSTPDSVANSITSDIDIRVRAAPTAWGIEQAFLSKYVGAGARSFTFRVIATKALRLTMTQAGTTNVTATSSVSVGFADGAVGWVRVTWRASDGRVQFFTSTDGTLWVQLGTDQTIAIASIFNGTMDVEIGSVGVGASSLFAGHIYYAELRNGIDGTVVQSFDATAVTKIGTRDPSTVAAGGPWTINGAAWDWVTV